MVRELFIASAMAAAVVATAPAPPSQAEGWAGDVPGIVYNVVADQRCDNVNVFVFGRGSSGQAMMCHFIPNQWPPKPYGTWVTSYPLYGVQDVGAPCPSPQAAAQSPDGRPMLCLGARGWTPGVLTGNGFFPT